MADTQMNYQSIVSSDMNSSLISERFSSIQKFASILIVDDNALNLIALQSQLKTMRDIQPQVQKIDMANNGEEAVILFQQRLELCKESNWLIKPYRVVIMDYDMPVMDGPEAVYKIRELCEQIKENDNPTEKHHISKSNDRSCEIEKSERNEDRKLNQFQREIYLNPFIDATGNGPG